MKGKGEIYGDQIFQKDQKAIVQQDDRRVSLTVEAVLETLVFPRNVRQEGDWLVEKSEKGVV